MAEYHAKRFAGIEGATVAAVCDHSAEKARDFASACGIGSFFGDPADMAASGSVDAISVAAYDGWHLDPVLAAADRGLPVFCEKPMARRLRDATAMAEAVLRAGVPAVVNFSKRNGGLLGLARRMIADGGLGALRSAEFRYLQSWLLQDAWGDWRSTPRWKWRLSESQSTYGAVGDLGSHLFDAALFLLGDCEIRGCASRRFAAGPDADCDLPGGPSCESFQAVLAAPTGHAVVSGSWRTRGKLDAFAATLYGETAAIDIDFGRSRTALLRYVAPGEAGSPVEAPKTASTYERFVALARGASDPVVGEPIDFAQGVEVQRLVEACGSCAESPR